LQKKVEMIVGVTFRHKVCQVQLCFATFNLFFDFPPDLFVGGCDAVTVVVVVAVADGVDGVAHSSTVSTYLCP
jgi:hypothetical protein